MREEYEGYIDVLTRGWDAFKGLFPRMIIDDETLWREMADRYGDYFDGGMGADAIKRLIDRIDLDVEEQKLRQLIEPTPTARCCPPSAARRRSSGSRSWRPSTAATSTAAASTTRGR